MITFTNIVKTKFIVLVVCVHDIGKLTTVGANVKFLEIMLHLKIGQNLIDVN